MDEEIDYETCFGGEIFLRRSNIRPELNPNLSFKMLIDRQEVNSPIIIIMALTFLEKDEIYFHMMPLIALPPRPSSHGLLH